MAIAREQASDGKIAANGEQAVGPCGLVRRENQRLGEQLHRPLVEWWIRAGGIRPGALSRRGPAVHQ